MARTELDKIHFQYIFPHDGSEHPKPRFDAMSMPVIESSDIYLAKPGHRTIGALNGIDKESCSLEINLNNTMVLEFTVNRIIDGEMSNYYDLIERHYELYVSQFGWFKINEEPEINNDGYNETKSIRAESGEIELQNYDLVGFRINTGSEDSRERLAIDNTYDLDGFNMARDNVKFWRDTSDLEAWYEEISDDATAEWIISKIPNHPQFYASWRIQYDLNGANNAIDSAITAYNNSSNPNKEAIINGLKSLKGKIKEQDDAYQLVQSYPLVRNYLTITGLDCIKGEDEEDYTPKEVIEVEIKRLKDLSFMDLVLKETGWTVGYVDETYYANSEDEADRERLADRIGNFDVSSQDVYSFLMQEASEYFRCIFDFDTENYKVNAYKVESLGVDTNIFLSFHNVQNSLTRSSDRELHTVYHVAAGSEDTDLDITMANFGDNAIEDLSYFMNHWHFPKDLIDKYENWYYYREGKRLDYMELAVKYKDALDNVKYIEDRVPNDGINPNQYSTMTVEQLAAERENYKAQLRGYEAMYVDDNNEFDAGALYASKDYPDYKMIKEVVLSVPADALVITQNGEPYEGELNDEVLKTLTMTYSDSAKLGMIDTEIFNRWQIAKNRTNTGDFVAPEKVKFREDYMYNLKEYGNSYGLTELKNLKKKLENEVYTLQNYESIEDAREEYRKAANEKYKKALKAYEDCCDVLDIRQSEADKAHEELDDIAEEMRDLEQEVSKEEFGFTEDEIWLLQRYYIHSDYINENIVVTEYSTNQEYVNQAYALIKDAQEELYADAHPQWSFATTQDNFLLMPELQDWHGHLEVGNYIHVAFREDSPTIYSFDWDDEETAFYDYDDNVLGGDNNVIITEKEKQSMLQPNQVELRLIKIRLNPFMNEPTIDLEFSNAVQYRSKRNDFVDLLGSYTGARKNAITSTMSSSKTETMNISSEFVMKLLNHSAFGAFANGIATSAASQAMGSTGGYISDAINNLNLSVDQVGDLTTRLTDLVNGYVDANVIATKVLYADEGIFDDITTDNAFVKGILTVGEDGITQIANNTITTDKIVARLVDATIGDFDSLTADSAFIQYLNVNGLIEAGSVSADQIIAGLASVDNPEDYSLLADSAFIDYLNSGVINTGQITTGTLIATMANLTQAQVQQLTAQSALVEGILTIGQDQITTIAEGTITTDKVVAALVDGKQGDFKTLTANTGFISYLNSGVIRAGIVSADTVIAALVDADVGDFDDLTAENGFVQYLQSVSNTTIETKAATGYFENLIAGNISVADLAAASATANEIVLIDDGQNPAISFKNATQQFYDDDGNVRVQIGQDGNGNFNFIVRGADGTTALFDENGITQSGIPNNTIINNMISDGTIQKAKMGFNIADANSDGTINIANIKDGSGGNFGASYTTFTQNTNNALGDLSDDIDEINNKKMYRIEITSSNGNYFKNGNINTTLSCHVYSWDDEITDDINASAFKWTKTNNDGTPDVAWNTAHFGGAKTVTITASDVYVRGTFSCTVTLPDGATVSSGD